MADEFARREKQRKQEQELLLLQKSNERKAKRQVGPGLKVEQNMTRSLTPELQICMKTNERSAKRQVIIGLACLCLISFCVSICQEMDSVKAKLRESLENTKAMIPFREARNLEPHNNAQLLWDVLMSQTTTGVEEQLREGTELYAVVCNGEGGEDVNNGDSANGNIVKQAARLTLVNDKIHLHALRDFNQPLPDKAMTLPYGAIYERVGSGSVLTFLELGWAGKSRGRLYIRMLGNTDRARQFTKLLTNEHGESYLNATFLQLMNKGTKGEYVTSGAYDGKGGAPPLVDGLTMGGPYRQPWNAGLVMGVWENNSAINAKFGIVLKNWTDQNSQLGFAQVEQGLETLIHAANRLPIDNIIIMDCGFVVPT